MVPEGRCTLFFHLSTVDGEVSNGNTSEVKEELLCRKLAEGDVCGNLSEIALTCIYNVGDVLFLPLGSARTTL